MALLLIRYRCYLQCIRDGHALGYRIATARQWQWVGAVNFLANPSSAYTFIMLEIEEKNV